MPSASSPVLADIDERGIATVALNRPEVGNAYDEALIQGLLAVLEEVAARPDLRAARV